MHDKRAQIHESMLIDINDNKATARSLVDHAKQYVNESTSVWMHIDFSIEWLIWVLTNLAESNSELRCETIMFNQG
jgi:hypothetical protein